MPPPVEIDRGDSAAPVEDPLPTALPTNGVSSPVKGLQPTTLDNSMQATSSTGGPSGWGREIKAEFRQTVMQYWWQEMKNFNFKTIGVTLFVFIAVMSPTLTFGAVYAKRTNNHMGTVELILATGFGGIIYPLVAGMPLMIMGGTGPTMTFQVLIFELSKKLDVPFLSLNAWVGFWVAFYLLVSAFFNLNRLIQYTTRFTDEIFAFLIIWIFIFDGTGNPATQIGLMHYFNPDHRQHLKMEKIDEDYDHLTTAFLSVVLGFGTTALALALRLLKHSPFCCNDWFRGTTTDFALTFSVALWTVVKEVLFPQVPTEQINVPESFATTFACCDAACSMYWPDDCPDQDAALGRRPWLVDLTDLNGKGWVIILAAGPAALGFILTFLNNGISWHILYHPSNKLIHGETFNYDTCIVAIMIAATSILGLPWVVISTVRCIMHVQALSERTKDGEVVWVQETRLTGILTHLLVFISLGFLPVIKLIPLPCLYGVFLFMGIVALPTTQFWQRLLLFLMQPSKYPKTPYTMFVKKGRIHLFTIIQLGFFVMLFTVLQIRTIAIGFPFFIFLCLPARLYLLPRIFSKNELIPLDGSLEEVTEFVKQNVAEEQMESTTAEPKVNMEDENDNNGAVDAPLAVLGDDNGGSIKNAEPRNKADKDKGTIMHDADSHSSEEFHA